MDHAILDQLQQRADATEHPKIRLYLPDADVPDPWERTPSDFTACAALIDQGADRHLP